MCYIARRDKEDQHSLTLHRNMTQSTHAIVSILREQLAGLAQAAQINLEKYQHQRHLYDELATTLQELLDREMSMRKQSWTNFEVQAEAILHNLATRSQHQFAKLHDSHTVLMHGLDQSTKVEFQRILIEDCR